MRQVGIVHPHHDVLVKLLVQRHVVANHGQHGTRERIAADHGHLQRCARTEAGGYVRVQTQDSLIDCSSRIN